MPSVASLTWLSSMKIFSRAAAFSIFGNSASNAARLLQCFMFSVECQQLMVDVGGLRSFHALVKDKPGRKPLREIKLMKDDAAAVEKQADDIKARYLKLFKV